jgi:hypothetical protein
LNKKRKEKKDLTNYGGEFEDLSREKEKKKKI